MQLKASVGREESPCVAPRSAQPLAAGLHILRRRCLLGYKLWKGRPYHNGLPCSVRHIAVDCPYFKQGAIHTNPYSVLYTQYECGLPVDILSFRETQHLRSLNKEISSMMQI